MKRIKLYILFLLFFIFLKGYAQLNEFLIESYFYGANSGINSSITPVPYNTLPWVVNADTYFSELKNSYNFNSILFQTDNSFPGANHDPLYKAASRAGLKLNLYVLNLVSNKTPPFNEQIAWNTLTKYTGSEYNTYGFHIIDEPDAWAPSSREGCKTTNYDEPHNGIPCSARDPKIFIDSIPQYTLLVKKYNENLLRYANLYGAQMFIDYDKQDFSYAYREEYIQQYINIAQPNVLSFDEYPVATVVNQFFISLYDMALKSVENSIPFIYVLTPYANGEHWSSHLRPSNNYFASKNKAQFNYVINAALAYGAKGISYWPGLEWVVNEAIYAFTLNYDTTLKNYLSNLHAKLIEKSDILLSLNFASAYHKSEASTIHNGVNESLYSFNQWSNLTNDEYAQKVFSNLQVPVYNTSTGTVPDELVITFHRDAANQIYFWVFNKSLTNAYNLKMNVKSSVYDVLNSITYSSSSIISFAAGEAKLFRFPIQEVIHDAYNIEYASGFNSLKVATWMLVGNDLKHRSVVYNTGAVNSYHADLIVIKSMHAKAGSTVRFKSYENTNTKNSASRTHGIESLRDTDYDVGVSLFDNSIIYPNPTNDVININLEGNYEDVALVELYNTNGIKFQEKKPTSSIETFEMYPYPQGMYIIKITFNNGESEHHKFIYK